MRKVVNYSVFIFIAIATIIGGYFYWLHEQRYPNTDDAYIQAYVIDVAPQVHGKVLRIFVTNQQHVNKGRLLFTIDPTPFEIAYHKALANLQNALQTVTANQQAVLEALALLKQNEAKLLNAKQQYHRIMPLVKKGFYAKSAGDNATQELTVAQQAVVASRNQVAEAQAKLGKSGNDNANVQLAEDNVAQAKLNLEYTTIVAPADGFLEKFALQPGQTVTAYQSLFSLIEDHSWWAMANMKETVLSRIHPGQNAMIHVDMYPSHPFHGVVSSISAGSGASFSLLPPENASGNWVKVVQRFPVRVRIPNPDPKYPLRIGASCTVSINTNT